MKDWTGNSKTIYTTLGASNHSEQDREQYDYYATDPAAVDYLLSAGVSLSQLKTVYVSRSRIKCAKNGKFKDISSSAVAYAWYEFEKGFQGDPVIKWIN